jgi:hypothetical protein
MHLMEALAWEIGKLKAGAIFLRRNPGDGNLFDSIS